VVVSGDVLDPDGAPVVGARVSLKVAGQPSTVGVTSPQGAFAVRVQTGDSLELTVVPPAGSGLPRLTGASSGAAARQLLGQPLQIRYRAGLARRDVGGVRLQRQGATAPGATAIFVGALAEAGGVNGGALPLAGEVRVAAVAGGDGRLPATQVPQAALSVVVQPVGGGQAVLPFDATAAPPPTLDAPAPQLITGQVMAAGAYAPGVLVELIPQGALALAGASSLSQPTAGQGVFSAPAAAGGSYLAVLSDPLQRGSSARVAVAGGTFGQVTLAPGWRLLGTVASSATSGAVRGAAVELFCQSCPAAERAVPLSSTATDDTGAFTLLVPGAAQ
jgi:hypothetical protein